MLNLVTRFTTVVRMPGSEGPMGKRGSRSKSKSPVASVDRDSGGESKPRVSTLGESPSAEANIEEPSYEGLAHVSVLQRPGEVARNLLADIEEAKQEDVPRGGRAFVAVNGPGRAVTGASTVDVMEDEAPPPPTPLTKAANANPIRIALEAKTGPTLDLLMVKNEVLRHFRVVKNGQVPVDVILDPGFNSMMLSQAVLSGLIGIFAMAGYHAYVLVRKPLRTASRRSNTGSN